MDLKRLRKVSSSAYDHWYSNSIKGNLRRQADRVMAYNELFLRTYRSHEAVRASVAQSDWDVLLQLTNVYTRIPHLVTVPL